MAQFYYYYGPMNAGKSISILKTAYNYTEQGKSVLLFTSGMDDRSGVGYISSRIGLKEEAQALYQSDNVYEIIEHYLVESTSHNPPGWKLDCILVDECQFLSEKQVKGFARIVDDFDIPVICYGLKTDFQNKLFHGAKALFEHADKFEEIKTICWCCGKKATMNIRLANGRPCYQGEQVQIGGNESYLPVCRKHYYKPLVKGVVDL